MGKAIFWFRGLAIHCTVVLVLGLLVSVLYSVVLDGGARNISLGLPMQVRSV